MDRIDIIRMLTEESLESLMARADAVRYASVGGAVRVRALLEFSNVCYRNCSYCGLCVSNSKLARYTMTSSEMIDTARRAYDVGYLTIVLQSGESGDLDIDMMCEVVRTITATGMVVTLSCGELDYESYARLYEAGARRYLLKHECANDDMYYSMHAGYTLAERVRHARMIKSIGYEYGGGFLVGLEGEDIDLIVDNLLLIRELASDMVGIGTYIPHEDTELRGCSIGDVELTLRCVAIARLLLPNANIPATTSLTVAGGGKDALTGGANVVMVKVTPDDYRRSYEIYPAEQRLTNIAKDRVDIESKLGLLSREVE